MTDVLGAVEHAKSEAREEVPRRQVTSDRPQLETGLAFQECADIL